MTKARHLKESRHPEKPAPADRAERSLVGAAAPGARGPREPEDYYARGVALGAGKEKPRQSTSLVLEHSLAAFAWEDTKKADEFLQPRRGSRLAT